MPTDRAEPVEGRHDRHGVEVEEIVRALRGYGVLTSERLAEAVNADNWPEHTFKTALRSAIDGGRVAALAGGLYELTERERRDG
jgi:hypothetical protein